MAQLLGYAMQRGRSLLCSGVVVWSVETQCSPAMLPAFASSSNERDHHDDKAVSLTLASNFYSLIMKLATLCMSSSALPFTNAVSTQICATTQGQSASVQLRLVVVLRTLPLALCACAQRQPRTATRLPFRGSRLSKPHVLPRPRALMYLSPPAALCNPPPPAPYLHVAIVRLRRRGAVL